MKGWVGSCWWACMKEYPLLAYRLTTNNLSNLFTFVSSGGITERSSIVVHINYNRSICYQMVPWWVVARSRICAQLSVWLTILWGFPPILLSCVLQRGWNDTNVTVQSQRKAVIIHTIMWVALVVETLIGTWCYAARFNSPVYCAGCGLRRSPWRQRMSIRVDYCRRRWKGNFWMEIHSIVGMV